MMLWQERKAGVGPGGAPLRSLWLGCACFVLALRAVAVPAAPGNLLATPANARVTVTWSAVTGATSYNVYRSLTPSGPYGSPLATGLTAATYTDNAVSNDTTYYYVATAVDGTGEGPRSAEDPATPRAGTFVSGIIGSTSGPITTTWNLAGSPYVVVGDVEVRGNLNTGNDRTSTLVIQPGVRILFEPGTGLFVGDDTGIVSGHSGRLQATGATFTSNRTSPTAGDWKGIRFGDTATDGATNNFLDGCTVEWAGGSGAAAAVAVNLSSPELRNGTVVRSTASGGVHVTAGGVAIVNGEIEGGSNPAVRLLGASSLSLIGTTLRNGIYPVQIQPNVVLSALSGNTASGYPQDRNGIAVEGGVMGSSGGTQSRTWPGGDLPYIVLSDLTVRGDLNTGNDRTSTLAITAPADVRFNSGVGLAIGTDTGQAGGFSGRLQATGVVFRGNTTVPSPGFWKGIYFADTTTGGGQTFLDACRIEEAGGAGALGSVVVNATSLELRNGTAVRGTATTGLHLTASVDSSAGVAGGEIEGGSGPAVQALGRSTLSLSGVTLRGGSYPVRIQPNVVLSALSGNTAAGYAPERNGIAVEGGVMGSSSGTQSRIWVGGDLPYIVLSDLEVRGDLNTGNDRTSTLTIGSGLPAEVRFESGAGLTIGKDQVQHGGFSGKLLATGVTFKGNTTSPAAGFWKGIYFADTATEGGIVLDGCVVEGAGGAGSSGAVAVNATSLVLRNGTAIRLSGNVGLWLSGSTATAATVTGGEIEGGSGPAVQALDRSTLSLTGVTLRGGTYPVRIQPNVTLSALSGNTSSGYASERNGVAVEGGVMGHSDVPQSRTWPGGNLPYIVLGNLTVRGNLNTGNDRTSTLVIASPSEVRFDSGAGLTIGTDSGQSGGFSGRLQATGVKFKGNTASPSPGFWKGIYFADTTTGGGQTFLDGCVVEEAGGHGALAAVVVSATSLELRNNTAILVTATTGLHLTASTDSVATVLGGEIEGGSGPAVQARDRSALGLTRVTLRAGTYPVRMQPNVVLSALSGNTAAGYAAERNGIAVEGGVMGSSGGSQSRTWPGGDLPYIVLGNLEVRGDLNTGNDRTSTLTIGSGFPAEVRFESGVGLTIGRDQVQSGGFSGKLLATRVTFKGNTTAPSAGFWKGIYFADTATEGGIVLDGCVVEGAGGAGSSGAVAVNATSLVLRNGTAIRLSGNVGLWLSGSTATAAMVTGGEIAGGSGPAVQALDRSTLSLTGVTLRSGTYPVRIQPNVTLSVLSGNTSSGYPPERNGVAIEGGVMGHADVPQSRTWPGGDLPYIVLGSLTVRGDRDTGNDRTSTLVIAGPSEVRFDSGAGLTIGTDSGQPGGFSGRLQATGVRFKGNTASPSPGFWKGIYFADTTTGGGQTFLDSCVVEEAGGHGSLAAVVVSATSLELRNNTAIRTTATTGLYLTASTDSAATVLDGEIEGGSGPAVQARDRSTLGLTGVTLRAGTYPVRMQPNVVLSVLSGNTAAGYAAERNGIAVEGGVMGSSGGTQSRTWPGGDLPYIVLGDLEVRGNLDTGNDRTSMLTIGSGLPAEVRFEAGVGLTIGRDQVQHGGFSGKLLATGVTFKGNTTAPSAGFWKGIYFADTATESGIVLDGCVVEGAGGAGSSGAVAVNATSLVLRNGTAIRLSGNVGLWLSGSTATAATVTGGEIEGGSGPAVQALDRSTLSLTGVTLRSGTYPVRIQPNVTLSALSGNSSSAYPPERNGVAVEGGVMGSSSGTQSRTWPGGDLPYIVLSDLTVRGDQNTGNDRTSTLVIAGPVEVRFDSGAGLTVGSNTGQHGGFSGQLQATGVTFKGNTAEPLAGFWRGIYFADTATAGGIFLDGCVVEGAGGTGSNGAVAVNATSLELRNGTVIHATGNAGLHLSASDVTAATVTGGEIQGGSGPAVQALGRSTLSLAGVALRNGTYPVQIQPNVILAALNSNAAAGYDPARDGIAVESGIMGGTAAQSRTWPGGDLPYIVLGDLAVRGDQNTGNDRTSTLMIGSPARVSFAAGAGLFIGDDSGIEGGHWGRLQATGVTFTASSATPVPGFWKGIYFGDQALDGAANTFLDACTVEWAGGDVAGAVRVNASAPVFKNGLAIHNTATAGVHLSSSSASNVSILGGEIEGGADAAVRAAGSSTLLLRDITLRGGPYPVRIDPNVNVAGLRGSRTEGYPFERAAVAVEGGVLGGGSPQTRVWPAADLPFLILGDVQVRGNQNTGNDRTSTLILQSGGEVRFERGAGLQIGDDSGIEGGHWGALRASGVTFTANTLSPVLSFWNGIYFADLTRDDLSFLFDGAVEYGGAAGGNVSISRSSPYLSGVVVRGSGQDGVLASNSNSVLTGSRLIGNPRGLGLFSSGALSLADSDVESNSRFGVFNGAPSSLFAQFNWWGDPSGPLDPASNPGGLGDRVSERVDYASWLTASPRSPVAPVSVKAQPGDGTVSLAWSASPEKDLTGYNVYRRLPPATAWTLRTSSPVPASASPSYQDTGLTNRTGHCYQVRAVDGQGREGDPSREACATPKTDVTPPAWTGPAGALFAEGGDGQAIVRFEPADDESSTAAYDLYYSTISPVDRSLPGVGRIANAVPGPGSAGHALEVTVPGLLNGRRYFFNLQAVDSEGNADGNAAEATAVIGPVSGALVAASPWTGATLDGIEVDGEGRAVLAAGRAEGQITSAVLELPEGANLSAVSWNAVQPEGTTVDTVPGGALTIEVRAAEDPAHVADARCITPTGLTAWWPGDGYGREIQAGRDGSLRNGVAFADGRSGRAFRLDGTDDWVDSTVDVSETAYTLSFWFKTSCSDCGLFSVDAGTLGSGGHDRHFYLSNGRLCSRVWSDETICTTLASYADERWHHAVHVFGGAVGGQKIFVDGMQRASGNKASSNFNWQDGINLGFSNDAANGFFRGLLDEVVVFNRALTAAEIQALYAAGGSGLCKPDADGDGVADLADACPGTAARTPVDAVGCPGGCFGPPSGRVSWWRGEGDAADSSGMNAGTLAGGTTFDLSQVGQAFRFDGINDRVEIPNFGTFTRVTVQAWVYREGATSTRESLVSYKEGNSPNCGFLLSLNEDGASQRPRMFVNVNGGWQSAEAPQPLPFGRWTHLAGTYDGQEIRLYVDGFLAAATGAVGNLTQCTQRTALGSRASFDQHFFPGLLDEVAIFDRALSASEVQALAETRGSGMCATAPPPSGAPAGTPQVEQGWVQVAPNQPFDLPDGRYVQVRITLRGDGTKSPALRSVSLGYRGGG